MNKLNARAQLHKGLGK
jgi:hypothetical protein